MDIKIKNEKCNFKFRVAGCLLDGDSILIVEVCHGGFYCFPGGHLHLGEDSTSALKREFKEETKFDCEVKNLFAIVENFFDGRDGKRVHEVCFYYLLQSSNIKKEDFSLIENDENILKTHDFKWCKLSELDKVDFRPYALKNKLINNDFSFSHIILHQPSKNSSEEPRPDDI